MASDWLILARLPDIGPAAFQKLLKHFGSPSAALRANEQDWLKAGLTTSQAKQALRTTIPDISADLAWLEQPDHYLITFQDPRYPENLRRIASPPPLLFLKGNPDILTHPQLAMVGSRNPTRAGAQTAREFASHLAGMGLCITSGLALGIDAASHEGALAAHGLTIAVAGTGLDRVYPARHRGLAARICENGALVSEFPITTPPQAENFPRRNRIISGLSLGTLVVEAARQSGSLISARYALEQGREVFAIPGSIHNPLARGCHQLIRQGAKLVESAADIVEELGPQLTALLAAPISSEASMEIAIDISAEQRQLLETIGFEPTGIDHIIQESGLTAESVSSMLLIMELNNWIASEPGGYYQRLK
jgi:DNA processing protein